jgi:5-formyltetrahydrofolate cyclo-ligase
MGITTLNRYGSRATPSAVLWVRPFFETFHTMLELKTAIRAKILEERRKLSAQARREKSEIILDTLLAWTPFSAASTIATYIPLKTEVDVSRLLERAGQAHRFVAPRTLPDFQMSFHELTQDTPLLKGSGNVMQPPDYALERPIEDIDLFLVPLAACDSQGNRLGFGKGYYDRALSSALGFKLGIGFGCQWVDAVPVDHYDVALDGFLSEEGLRCF